MTEQFAPPFACGEPQVIPNRGPHIQLYIDPDVIKQMVYVGLVRYDPEYGPGARVYRPTMPADAAKVMSWIGD